MLEVFSDGGVNPLAPIFLIGFRGADSQSPNQRDREREIGDQVRQP
jgi:hypothetical protein